MNLEPCPCCNSLSLSTETPSGESRARIACFSCGAKGPMVGLADPRPWDIAAAEEWNTWAMAKRHHPGGTGN
jgi:hypothetical protein